MGNLPSGLVENLEQLFVEGRQVQGLHSRGLVLGRARFSNSHASDASVLNCPGSSVVE